MLSMNAREGTGTSDNMLHLLCQFLFNILLAHIIHDNGCIMTFSYMVYVHPITLPWFPSVPIHPFVFLPYPLLAHLFLLLSFPVYACV